MADELTLYGVGGAIFLSTVSLLLRQKHGSSAGKKSGEMPPEYWQLEFKRAVAEGVREAMAGRNEELRRMMREEIEEVLQRSKRPR